MAGWNRSVAGTLSGAVIALTVCGAAAQDLEQARRLAALGSFEDALQVAEEIVRRNPDHVEGHEFLAREMILHPRFESQLRELSLTLPGASLNNNSLTYSGNARAVPDFQPRNITVSHARQHLQALAELAAEEGTTTAQSARAALQRLIEEPVTSLRGETAQALQKKDFPGRTEMLLSALDREESTGTQTLAPILRALAETSSTQAFTRVLSSYQKELEEAAREPLKASRRTGQTNESLYLSALLDLPNPSSTEQLLADVESTATWKQELAVRELLRRRSENPEQNGALRLLNRAFQPRPFPFAAWNRLDTWDGPRTGSEARALEEALRSDDPRIVARAVMLSQKVPENARGALQDEVVRLVVTSRPDARGLQNELEALLDPPGTSETMQQLSNHLLLRPDPQENTGEQQIRLPRRYFGADSSQLVTVLGRVTSEPLQQVFARVLDEATSPGASVRSSLQAIERAGWVLNNWEPGPGSRALTEAVDRMVTGKQNGAGEAVDILKNKPLGSDDLKLVLGWLDAVTAPQDLDTDRSFNAVASVVSNRHQDPFLREWARKALRSSKPAEQVIASIITSAAAQYDPASFTAEDEAAVEHAQRSLKEEISRQEQNGITPPRQLRGGEELARQTLDPSRGTGTPGGKWYLR